MTQISDSSIMNSSLLILTNYWIITFSGFHYVTGEKPHCTGQPLEHEEYSSAGDVGYVRDVCVDIIARNINNTLRLSASKSCEELANIRTSTCYSKNMCIKWRRACFWNASATNQVTRKAEKMIDRLNNEIPTEALLNQFDDEKFIYEHIVDAQSRLLDSGAASEDSKIIGNIASLKINHCTSTTLGQYQREYQIAVGQNDPKIMERVDELVRNTDLINLIKILIRNFEAENGVKITKIHALNKISKISDNILVGIPRLYIEYKKGTITDSISAFSKIPSLYSMKNDLLRKNMFDREVHFYETLLPKLYELGNCKPFAPKLYAATTTKAFAIEDLSSQGYYVGDKVEQLDWNEICIALNLLANYHALSNKYLQSLSKNDPGMSLIQSYQVALTPASWKSTFQAFCDLLKPFLNEELYQKIIGMEKEILAEPRITEYPAEDSMTVIIHEDYRTNNILFKKDEDVITQAKLIDWQTSREANPVLDLIYFFITSVPIDIFETNDDTLINYYLDNLNSVLSSIESTRFYYRPELDRDILYYKYYYFKVLLINWPILLKVGFPLGETDAYITSALKWIDYFEKKQII